MRSETARIGVLCTLKALNEHLLPISVIIQGGATNAHAPHSTSG